MSVAEPSRIGIIAGSGPEAGLDLWSKLLEENRLALGSEFRGDIDAPNVTVISVPELGHSMDLPETRDRVWNDLRDACERLAPQVDRFAIACNTLYAFEDDVRSLGLTAHLQSPVDSALNFVRDREIDSVALLGAGPVTDLESGHSPYARLGDEVELELPMQRDALHSLIEEVKLVGGSSPEIERSFSAITGDLNSDTALLACTELPLIRAREANIALIDVTRLVAKDLLSAR